MAKLNGKIVPVLPLPKKIANYFPQVRIPLQILFFFFKCWYLKVAQQTKLWCIFWEYFFVWWLVLTKIRFLNRSSKWRTCFYIELHLLCVSINSTDFALTGLEENMVENSEDFSSMTADYIFCSIFMIPFFYIFSNLLFKIESCSFFSLFSCVY